VILFFVFGLVFILNGIYFIRKKDTEDFIHDSRYRGFKAVLVGIISLLFAGFLFFAAVSILKG